jgi:GGDEF domain-containing protein
VRWPRPGLQSILMLLLLAWQSFALAVPQINWSEMLAQGQSKQGQADLTIDLRTRWQATRVSGLELANDVPLDPAEVWAWPAERFSLAEKSHRMNLRSGERQVARITLFSERLVSDFSLTMGMPRLDAVHVSYRLDGGPWTTLSAGDTLSMQRWPLPDRQPSFILPLPPGQTDVILQFVHRGVMDMPVLLQNNRAFLESRTTSVWVAGLFVGVNVVMALMGLLMALNFSKLGFLSVTAMSMMVALVLMFGSGLGGMLLMTSSENFNDQVKFVVNISWGLVLPWVASIALGMRAYSRGWSWSAALLAIGGIALVVAASDYRIRDFAPISIGALLLVVSIYVVTMMAWVWYKNYSRNILIFSGLLLYLSMLFLLFVGYMGLLDTDTSGIVAALISLLASLVLIRGLFLQHRMGRQVLARANISPLRDVLTGLLNRDGMQAHLYKIRDRLQQQQTCAVFIFISVLDAEAAMNEHGEQGFEMGMVQMAASLSTSVAGTDGVGRISGHAFGISVMMPPDPILAVRMAQKILSRLMVLASHGAPMASTARMALAWMPLNGFRIDTLERRCQMTLQTLEASKRIGWVGGAQSHSEAAQLLRDATLANDTPGELPESPTLGDTLSQDASAANLYERIHRIEREMLHGMDTRFLVEEADRMSRLLNEAHSSQDSIQTLSTGFQEPPPDYLPTAILRKA